MYLNYYNFREEPFRLTSDPRFFHLAEPHAVALTTLIDAVTRRKGFVVVSGEIGTGKTMILHTALQILAEKASGSPMASAFVLNPLLTRDEFLEMVLTEFEIPCTGVSKPARLGVLHRMLLDTQRKGGTSVLLVDEAHLLSAELLEEIRLLSNADTYREKLLQIVLCGQPELLTLLRKPELRALHQRVSGTCVLRPLSCEEMRAFIAERMHAAGFLGTVPPFGGPAFEVLFRYSRGVPRLINLLCDACLAAGFKKRQPVILLDTIEEVAGELGLKEAPSGVAVRGQNTVPAVASVAANAAVTQAVITAFDLMIQAMKQGRSSAMER